jgi:hypothetical protein
MVFVTAHHFDRGARAAVDNLHHANFTTDLLCILLIRWTWQSHRQDWRPEDCYYWQRSAVLACFLIVSWFFFESMNGAKSIQAERLLRVTVLFFKRVNNTQPMLLVTIWDVTSLRYWLVMSLLAIDRVVLCSELRGKVKALTRSKG